jgi:chemotaxis signal transduction protein
MRAGGYAYGIPVASVLEVTRMVALSPLPDGPSWMAGVVDLRGLPVPVVDLAARLGRAAQAPVLDRRIVVTGDPADPVGLIVDDVTGVAPAGPSSGDAGGAPASPLVRRTVRIGEDLVMVLDEGALRVGTGA